MEGLGLIVILLGIYMAPWFIALVRGHRNTVAIFALNLLLGWTLIGWVGALVWALMNQDPAPAPYPYPQQQPQMVPPPQQQTPSLDLAARPQNAPRRSAR